MKRLLKEPPSCDVIDIDIDTKREKQVAGADRRTGAKRVMDADIGGAGGGEEAVAVLCLCVWKTHLMVGPLAKRLVLVLVCHCLDHLTTLTV